MQNLLIRLLEPKTNEPQMPEVLLSLLNVKIPNSILIKEIEEHPNYPGSFITQLRGKKANCGSVLRSVYRTLTVYFTQIHQNPTKSSGGFRYFKLIN